MLTTTTTTSSISSNQARRKQQPLPPAAQQFDFETQSVFALRLVVCPGGGTTFGEVLVQYYFCVG
jgi:hypothetical protein